MLARAEELGLSLSSPAEEITQRLAQDDAVLETLRSLDPALVDHDPTQGRAALSVRDPAPTRTTRPPLFWRGEQPDPPAPATVADRRGPTWISVVDDPRVSPGGPLTGWEVGVKDLMAVEGCELTAGTRAHQGRTAAADAPAVAALRSAGATIRGTVNLHALAYGATGTSSDWGVPTNPAVAGAIPGGSSSGSAAAVAEGTAALALGTDTSGSIRIPAALCGVVGLKPTRGLVSTQGCHPLSPTLDHIGPLGASVRPVAAAMSALAGWSGWRLPEEPEGTIRVGVLGGYFAEGVTAPVATAFAHACEQLERHGVELVPVELPLARHVPGAQIALLGTEALESNLETLRARGGLLPADVRLRLEAHGDLAQSFEPGEFAWANERTADLIVSEALARRAFFPAGASARRIARTGLYLGEPVLAETRLLPEGLSAEDAAAGGTTGASYTSCSLDIAYAAPDGAERLGAGAPLVVARIHAYGGDGRILCYRELALRADVFEFES